MSEFKLLKITKIKNNRIALTPNKKQEVLLEVGHIKYPFPAIDNNNRVFWGGGFVNKKPNPKKLKIWDTNFKASTKISA